VTAGAPKKDEIGDRIKNAGFELDGKLNVR
jgi:hypothetical protein